MGKNEGMSEKDDKWYKYKTDPWEGIKEFRAELDILKKNQKGLILATMKENNGVWEINEPNNRIASLEGVLAELIQIHALNRITKDNYLTIQSHMKELLERLAAHGKSVIKNVTVDHDNPEDREGFPPSADPKEPTSIDPTMKELVENREKFTLENYKKAEPTPPPDKCQYHYCEMYNVMYPLNCMDEKKDCWVERPTPPSEPIIYRANPDFSLTPIINNNTQLRERLGKKVSEIWSGYCKRMGDSKERHLMEWEYLHETDKEIDREIGEILYKLGEKEIKTEVVSRLTELMENYEADDTYEHEVHLLEALEAWRDELGGKE